MQHYNIKFSYFKALPVATPTLGDQGAIRLLLAVVDPQEAPHLIFSLETAPSPSYLKVWIQYCLGHRG